jgi:hypothetical protein
MALTPPGGQARVPSIHFPSGWLDAPGLMANHMPTALCSPINVEGGGVRQRLHQRPGQIARTPCQSGLNLVQFPGYFGMDNREWSH